MTCANCGKPAASDLCRDCEQTAVRSLIAEYQRRRKHRAATDKRRTFNRKLAGTGR